MRLQDPLRHAREPHQVHGERLGLQLLRATDPRHLRAQRPRLFLGQRFGPAEVDGDVGLGEGQVFQGGAPPELVQRSALLPELELLLRHVLDLIAAVLLGL